MTWNGTLITLEGARQLFDGWGLEFSHNTELDIYECEGLSIGTLQAKTLISLCQKVISRLAGSLPTTPY